MNDEQKLAVAAAHREDQVKTMVQNNCDIIEAIKILKPKRGIQSMDIVHEYFDL